MTVRVLVACVGNIFRGDDGVGVEVAGRLLRRPLPGGVRVVDFGIRSVHLAYELLDGGYDVLVLVDAVAQQTGPPGTLYVIEPDVSDAVPPQPDALPPVVMDPHDLSAGSAALELVPSLGGAVDRVLVVGVQPGTVEDGIGLSDEVAGAVGPAADLVLEVVLRVQAEVEGRRTSC
jgi:hydrogenase maturation protease